MQQHKIDWFNENNKVGIRHVIKELVVRHICWGLDNKVWFVELKNDKKVFVTTNHGTPVIWPQDEVQEYFKSLKKEANEYRLCLKEMYEVQPYQATVGGVEQRRQRDREFPALRVIADLFLTSASNRTLILVPTVSQATALKEAIITRPCDTFFMSYPRNERTAIEDRARELDKHVVITLPHSVSLFANTYKSLGLKIILAWPNAERSPYYKMARAYFPDAEFINSYEGPK